MSDGIGPRGVLHFGLSDRKNTVDRKTEPTEESRLDTLRKRLTDGIRSHAAEELADLMLGCLNPPELNVSRYAAGVALPAIRSADAWRALNDLAVERSAMRVGITTVTLPDGMRDSFWDAGGVDLGIMAKGLPHRVTVSVPTPAKGDIDLLLVRVVMGKDGPEKGFPSIRFRPPREPRESPLIVQAVDGMDVQPSEGAVFPPGSEIRVYVYDADGFQHLARTTPLPTGLADDGAAAEDPGHSAMASAPWGSPLLAQGRASLQLAAQNGISLVQLALHTGRVTAAVAYTRAALSVPPRELTDEEHLERFKHLMGSSSKPNPGQPALNAMADSKSPPPNGDEAIYAHLLHIVRSDRLTLGEKAALCASKWLEEGADARSAAQKALANGNPAYAAAMVCAIFDGAKPEEREDLLDSLGVIPQKVESALYQKSDTVTELDWALRISNRLEPLYSTAAAAFRLPDQKAGAARLPDEKAGAASAAAAAVPAVAVVPAVAAAAPGSLPPIAPID